MSSGTSDPVIIAGEIWIVSWRYDVIDMSEERYARICESKRKQSEMHDSPLPPLVLFPILPGHKSGITHHILISVMHTLPN